MDTNAEDNAAASEAEIQIFAGQLPPQFYQSYYESTTPENSQGAE